MGIKDVFSFVTGVILLAVGIVTFNPGLIIAGGAGIVGSFFAERVANLISNPLDTNQSYLIVYGNTRVGPRMVDRRIDDASIESRELYLTGILCTGSRSGAPNDEGISAINEIYLDNKLAVDAAGTVQPEWQSSTALVRTGDADVIKYVGKHLGTTTQTVDSTLNNKFASVWDSDHRARKLAYLVVDLWFVKAAFQVGQPPIVTADVDGRVVWDPRLGASSNAAAWTHSSNVALVLLDYILDDRYGWASILDIGEADIDLQTFRDMADHCDETVSVPDGNGGTTTQARYTFDGVIDTSNSVLQNTREILSSCGNLGELIPQADEIRFHIRRDVGTAPFGTIALDISTNILGDPEFNVGLPGTDKRFNEIRARYIDPDQDYRLGHTQWPEAGANTWLDDDNGKLASATIDLPGIQDVYRAQQLAMVWGKESRIGGATCALTANDQAFSLEVGDVVEVTHDYPGWNPKPFWVRGTFIAMPTEPGEDVAVRLLLQEYEPSSYSLDAQSDAPTYPDTNLLDDQPGAPTNLAATSDESTAVAMGDGGTNPRIKVTWTKAPHALLDYTEIQAKLDSESVWDTYGRVPEDEDQLLYLAEFGKGDVVDIRARSVSIRSAPSAWTTLENHTVGSKTSAPTTPSGFAGTFTKAGIRLSWTAHPDVDFDHFELREGATWAGATVIDDDLVATNWFVPIDKLGDFSLDRDNTFRLRAFDRTGNQSAEATLNLTDTAPDASGITLSVEERAPYGMVIKATGLSSANGTIFEMYVDNVNPPVTLYQKLGPFAEGEVPDIVRFRIAREDELGVVQGGTAYAQMTVLDELTGALGDSSSTTVLDAGGLDALPSELDPGTPTNDPVPENTPPTALTPLTLTDGSIALQPYIESYLQGALEADYIEWGISVGGTTSALSDANLDRSHRKDPAHMRGPRFTVDSETDYSFGVRACRLGPDGIECNAWQSPSSAPDWQGINSGDPDTPQREGIKDPTGKTYENTFGSQVKAEGGRVRVLDFEDRKGNVTHGSDRRGGKKTTTRDGLDLIVDPKAEQLGPLVKDDTGREVGGMFSKDSDTFDEVPEGTSFKRPTATYVDGTGRIVKVRDETNSRDVSGEEADTGRRLKDPAESDKLPTTEVDAGNLPSTVKRSDGGAIESEPSAQTKADTAEQAAKDASEPRITKGTTAPASPTLNEFWLDTNVSPALLKRWDGGAWVASSATEFVEMGGDLDDIADGTTYAKPRGSHLSDGKPNLRTDGTVIEGEPGAQSKADAAETNAKQDTTNRGLDPQGDFKGTVESVPTPFVRDGIGRPGHVRVLDESDRFGMVRGDRRTGAKVVSRDGLDLVAEPNSGTLGSGVTDDAGRTVNTMFDKSGDRASDVKFDDGVTTVEARKPDEVGAEQTTNKPWTVMADRDAPNLDPGNLDTGVKRDDGANIESEPGAQSKADAAESAAKAASEGKIHRSNTAPGDTSLLWLDTSTTPYVWKRWNGSAWVKATPTVAAEIENALDKLNDTAGDLPDGSLSSGVNRSDGGTIESEAGATTKADAAEAAAKAASEGKVHRDTTAPGDTSLLWLDTSTDPHIWKRHDGVDWVKATPSEAAEITNALDKANDTAADLPGGNLDATVKESGGQAIESEPGAQSKADAAETNAKADTTTRGLSPTGDLADATIEKQPTKDVRDGANRPGHTRSLDDGDRYGLIRVDRVAGVSTVTRDGLDLVTDVDAQQLGVVTDDQGRTVSGTLHKTDDSAADVPAGNLPSGVKESGGGAIESEPGAQSKADAAESAAKDASEPTVPKQSSAPVSPATDDLWIDTSVTPNQVKRWNGSTWVKATPSEASEITNAYDKLADDLDDVSDGTTHKRTDANERDGGGRGFNTIDSSNRVKDQSHLPNTGHGNIASVLDLTGVGTLLFWDANGASWDLVVRDHAIRYGFGEVTVGDTSPGGSPTQDSPFGLKQDRHVYLDNPSYADDLSAFQTVLDSVSARPDAIGPTAGPEQGRTYIGFLDAAGNETPDGGGCIAIDDEVPMWVNDDTRVEELREGDEVCGVRAIDDLVTWRVLVEQESMLANCMYLRSRRSGAVKMVSCTTPMQMRDGSWCWAHEVDGREVLVLIDGKRQRWESVDAHFIGMRVVKPVYVGGEVIFAGADPGLMIGSHNALK